MLFKIFCSSGHDLLCSLCFRSEISTLACGFLCVRDLSPTTNPLTIAKDVKFSWLLLNTLCKQCVPIAPLNACISWPTWALKSAVMILYHFQYLRQLCVEVIFVWISSITSVGSSVVLRHCLFNRILRILLTHSLKVFERHLLLSWYDKLPLLHCATYQLSHCSFDCRFHF